MQNSKWTQLVWSIGTLSRGETLEGSVEMTIVRGEKIFERGWFAPEPKGEQCFRA